MNISIILLSILLLFMGCSTQKQSSELDTVSFSSNQDNKLQINEEGPDSIGKETDSAQIGQSEKIEKEPIISLSIYSSLYSSLALVELFKKFEKQNINLAMITANGFAAVVAAIYIKEKSSNALEWKLFALLKKLKGTRPYTKEWKEIVTDFLEDEFESKRLDSFKTKLSIPRFYNGNAKLIESGEVVKVITRHLDINDRSNYFKKPEIYKRNLVESPSDLNFNIVFLPDEVSFKIIDGYSWGIFTNYLGFVMKHSDEIHKIKTSKAIYVDELLPLSDIVSAYEAETLLTLEKYQLEINTWKEEFTASSN